jgi:hypothetical protein
MCDFGKIDRRNDKKLLGASFWNLVGITILGQNPERVM